LSGPQAALRVSEVFLSLQGEGPSAGTPAHFVRLQGCSVGCRWCDTKYSWDPLAGRASTVAGLLDEAADLGPAPLLVVTGGEPLESPAIRPLLEHGLERWEHVEVETGGLLPPVLSHPRLRWSVSPKLPRATPRWESTWRHAAAWLAEPGATFKIVVGDPPDEDDLLRLLARHAVPAARVMLMPEGYTDDGLRDRAMTLATLCKRHGFRLSARMHVWLWGARRGV
jgi:7-carboxy-7-deazaguanine synthase